MKKTLCALLALALCSSATAEIALVPAGSFSDYAYFEDDCARVIDADADYREGVFDIEGRALIPCEYEALSGYGAMDYYVAQQEDGLNVRGALDAAGNEVIPFEYGDIRFLSERWALGVTLEETTIKPCDYEDYIDDKDYNATSYAVYDLSGRGYVGFFSYRSQVIRAHGDYLYVQDREGRTAIYDEDLRRVREGVADPYAAFDTIDGNVVSLSTGATVLSGYRFGAELGGGLISVSDDSYAIGIGDISGRLLTDCTYDRVFAADISGDVRVEKDEQFGLVARDGSEAVPCAYDGIERLAFAGGYVYRLRGYACVQQGDGYNYLLPDGRLTYTVFYRDVDILGLSMIVTDIYGQKHILAADGVRTATDYQEFAAFPGGDGTILKARGADGLWYLIDWHANLLLPDGYPYAISLLIAPDGSAVLAESESGKAGYTVSR